MTLAACADGVGTKVLLGIKAKRLHGLGIDLVAMNVNDLITCGARPLFFLDSIAVHRLEPKRLLEVIEGMSEGCRQAECALLGGETAQMPDMYARGQFDLAGFAVGIVEQGRAIDGAGVAPGDVLIGLPSNGLHSNGYSLLRKWLARRQLKLNRHYGELGESLADAVLRPTKVYVRDVLSVLDGYRIRRVVTGMAHITGGGLPENVGRVLGSRCNAVIETGSWKPPPIYRFMQKRGMKRAEMFRAFNMGIGFVLAVRPRYAKSVLTRLEDRRASPLVIGGMRRGTGKVLLR